MSELVELLEAPADPAVFERDIEVEPAIDEFEDGADDDVEVEGAGNGAREVEVPLVVPDLFTPP